MGKDWGGPQDSSPQVSVKDQVRLCICPESSPPRWEGTTWAFLLLSVAFWMPLPGSVSRAMSPPVTWHPLFPESVRPPQLCPTPQLRSVPGSSQVPVCVSFVSSED